MADDDFLVKQLRTRKGRKLLSRISQYPEGIDRLDRMRYLPRGEKTTKVFIQDIKDNYSWIETMTTSKRGQRFANDIAKSKGGKDYDQPTGRIYNVPQLIGAMKVVYEGEMSR